MSTTLHTIGMCALWVAMGWPAIGSETLAVRASPTSGFAPSDVVVQALIEPDARNRALSFVVESPRFYASSMVELPGERAPRLKDVRFRMLPAGSYEVRVTLLGTEGERGRVVRGVNLW